MGTGLLYICTCDTLELLVNLLLHCEVSLKNIYFNICENICFHLEGRLISIESLTNV